MTPHEFEVVEMMDKFGGSFVKALANCFRCADPLNFKKLQLAFANYWREYEDMLERQDDHE